MSYLNRVQDPRRRTTAIAGVVLVHAVLGYALIAGLTIDDFIKIEDDFGAIFIPPEADPPPPPPPQPVDETLPEVTTVQSFVAPQPPIDLTPVGPISPLPLDPQAIPIPTVTRMPTPNVVEPPRPQPSFAPKRALPRGDTSRWVTPNDYPSRELRMGVEGTTHFRVTVGTDGRVGACEVTRSSGNARLDAAVCSNIRSRARFEPAIDGNGQKVVGSYSNSVLWQIPD